MIIEVERNTQDTCFFCGNDIYCEGLCKEHFDHHRWLENSFSCLDGMKAYELIEECEYSDDYFDPRNKRTKPEALLELYKIMSDTERKEFRGKINALACK